MGAIPDAPKAFFAPFPCATFKLYHFWFICLTRGWFIQFGGQIRSWWWRGVFGGNKSGIAML
jgi:hypothetical protein